MRILIDTNVLISLEDDRIVREEVAKLISLATGKHEILVHPEAMADIERDRNRSRAEITSSKLKKYKVLERPPVPDSKFIHRFAPKGKPNDIVDAHLLYAVKMNSVNMLVTNDFELARRAAQIDLENRVYDPVEALQLLEGLELAGPRRHTAVESVPAHNLDSSDRFFDSFREDYEGFDAWLARISQEGRRAYVLREGARIEAVMIYKDEHSPDSPGVPADVLKIATLKVSDAVRGQKVGELFLKLAIRMAFARSMKGVYVTVYPKYGQLCNLLEEFGFESVGQKPDKRGGFELVYLKSLAPGTESQSLDPVSVVKKWFPSFVDGARVRKYFVPIQPGYHNRLFPEVKGRHMRIADYSSVIAEGNTIRKAYLSKSHITSVIPGSLLLFYRSKDSRAMTSIGVVDEVLRCAAPEEIMARVGKRTVYSATEVTEMCADGDLLALLFWHVSDVPHPPTFEQMRKLNLIKGPIQSIQELPHPSYVVLKEVMGLDKRATLN